MPKFIAVLTLLAVSACSTDIPPKPERPGDPKLERYSGAPELESNVGEGVSTTFTWTLSTGRSPEPGRQPRLTQPKFKICTAPDGSTSPRNTDRCDEFTNVTCVVRGSRIIGERWECSGSYDVPDELADTSGNWYVRAEDPGYDKGYVNSNMLPFQWTLLGPDLVISDIDVVLLGGYFTIPALVDNIGNRPADDPVVRFTVKLTIAGAPQPLQVFDPLIESRISPGGQDGVSIEVVDPTIRPTRVEVDVFVDPDNEIEEKDETNNTARKDVTYR